MRWLLYYPMNIWLVLPVKPFALGKSRLSTVLDKSARIALNRALMMHVLETALATKRFAGIVVVSRDPVVREIAHSYFVESLEEEDEELNLALLQGRTYLMQKQVDGLFVLPADLPLLTVDDLNLVLDAGEATNSVVIAPSPDGGTNALLLRPPDVLPFQFGHNSFQHHCASAHRAKLVVHQVSSPGLQTDIDMPSDLLQLPSSLFSPQSYRASSPQA